MNRLEEYIRDHKRLFEEEPEAGHFERLQQKMTRVVKCRDAARHVSTIRTLRWAIPIAASIALLLTAGLVWQHAARQNGIMTCENASDMKICYLEKMNRVAGQIETLVSDFDQWDRQQVMSDVQEIIDAVNGGFESEIQGEVPDGMAKTILADYYRQNLEGLEMIVRTITD